MKKYEGKAYLSVDNLFIDGIKYRIENLHELPEDLSPRNVAEEKDGSTYCFFTAGSPLSNFFKCNLSVNDNEYNCTEQGFCHMKCMLFNDKRAADRVMSETEPLAQKEAAGDRNLSSFDKQKWELNRDSIMKKCLIAKYTQNDGLRQHLLGTGDMTLGEASMSDKYWGTGVGLRHSDTLKPSKWTGINKMGILLTEIRDLVRRDAERKSLSAMDPFLNSGQNSIVT
jgi:ribA/ribD-fused uncharacterized protein